MYILGLTGGLACGKTYVAQILAEHEEVCLLSADAVGHELLQKDSALIEQIRCLFGPEVIGPNGIVLRAVLAEKVFADEQELKRLEALMHPAIKRELWRRIDALAGSSKQMVVLEAPLLLEAGWQKDVNLVVVVCASQAQQVKRACARGAMSDVEARQRMALQWSTERKCQYADVVIDNNGSKQETRRLVENLWQDKLRNEMAKTE